MQRPKPDEHAAAKALCQSSLGSGLVPIRCMLQPAYLLVSLHKICCAHVSCLSSHVFLPASSSLQSMCRTALDKPGLLVGSNNRDLVLSRCMKQISMLCLCSCELTG